MIKAEDYQNSISVKLCNIFKDMAYVNGKVTEDSIHFLDKAYDFCTNLNDEKLEGDVC